MTLIKICGITNKDDALYAASLGVDMLGFVFYSKSPRYVSPKQAKDIISSLPETIKTVGVFVDESPDKVKTIINECRLDYAQFHGNEDPAYVNQFKDIAIKAFRVRQGFNKDMIKDYKVYAFLFDTFSKHAFGGTGETFDWNAIKGITDNCRIILSGGLNPKNVKDAVMKVRPFAVDTSSGVESSPGKKDHDKIAEFIRNVK